LFLLLRRLALLLALLLLALPVVPVVPVALVPVPVVPVALVVLRLLVGSPTNSVALVLDMATTNRVALFVDDLNMRNMNCKKSNRSWGQSVEAKAPSNACTSLASCAIPCRLLVAVPLLPLLLLLLPLLPLLPVLPVLLLAFPPRPFPPPPYPPPKPPLFLCGGGLLWWGGKKIWFNMLNNAVRASCNAGPVKRRPVISFVTGCINTTAVTHWSTPFMAGGVSTQ